MLVGTLRITALLILWAAAIATSGAAEFSGIPRPQDVIDGDDLRLCPDDGSACTRIRLCGIDAPERGCPGNKEGRKGLQALVVGKRVRCIQVGAGTPCDGRSEPTNKRRVVAQCFVDGTDVAGVLVERGFACDWKKFSDGHYS